VSELKIGRKMKILYIAPYFYPAESIGGTANVLYNLSKALIKKGHAVTIYSTDLLNNAQRVRYPHNTEIDISGIKVIYFSNISNYLAYKYHFFFSPKFFIHFLRHIKEFDIVHIHEIYTLMNLWVGYWAWKMHIPYLITSHGTLEMKKEEGRVAWKKIFLELGGMSMLKTASCLIALTLREKTTFKNLGLQEDKISVIPNGINENIHIFRNKSSKFLKKFHLPSNSKILLFLGRIHRKKGIHLAIKSLSMLKGRYKNLILVISGPVEDSNYYNSLVNEIADYGLKEKVFFTGSLMEEDKNNAFDSSDIFILTSYSEGLPCTALEAAFSGVPLLVSGDCNIPEVKLFGSGIIVELNTKSIVSGIIKIMSRADYRNFYGNNGRKMVKDRFSLNFMTKNTEKLYFSIHNRL